MPRFLKWILVLALLLLILMGAAALALQRWVGTDDFRARVREQVSQALGVDFRFAGVEVDAWPLPAVAVNGISIQTQPPLALEHVEARPALAALLRGRLEVATLIVRGASLPQPGIDALLASLQKKRRTEAPASEPAAEPGAAAYIPRHVVLDNVTWLDSKGVATTVDANARVGSDAMPESATLKIVKGRLAGAKAELEREGNDWAVRLEVGGGTVKGKITLDPGSKPGSGFAVKGQLDTLGVEVAALTVAASGAKGPLSGRLEAATSLASHALALGGLGDALQTQTRFTVHNAVVHGIDLAKAVQTVGISRGGETKLDTLAGQVVTQGKAVQLNNLVASSGVLSANGNVAIAPSRALSGRVTVDLAAKAVGGAVGVPLVVGGTVDAPEVTLSRGAMVGAAIGTMLLPGAGTGAGAKLGDKLGSGMSRFFGGSKP